MSIDALVEAMETKKVTRTMSDEELASYLHNMDVELTLGRKAKLK